MHLVASTTSSSSSIFPNTLTIGNCALLSSEPLLRLRSLPGMPFPPLSYLTGTHLTFGTLCGQPLSAEPSDSFPLCSSVLPADVHLQSPLHPFIFPTRLGMACGQVAVIRALIGFKETWYVEVGGTWVIAQTLQELFALGQVICILNLDFLSSAYLPGFCEVSCEMPATVLGSLCCVCGVLSHFSHVQLFTTLWTVGCQAPLSMGFSRQEYWSGFPCPSPENSPDPGIEPVSHISPALAGGFFTTSITGKPLAHCCCCC